MTKARSSRRRLTRWSIFRSRRLEAGRRHAAGLQPHERDAEKRSRHPQAPPSDPSVQGTLGSLLLLSSNLVPRSNSLAISYYVKPEPPILFKFLERHLAASGLVMLNPPVPIRTLKQKTRPGKYLDERLVVLLEWFKHRCSSDATGKK